MAPADPFRGHRGLHPGFPVGMGFLTVAGGGIDYLASVGDRATGDLLLAEGDLVAHLERKFKLVAFFNRVGLEDLALAFPEAAGCRDKSEFLRHHLEILRALILLGLESAPAEVGRLAGDYPDVARLLVKFKPGL